MAHKWVQTDSYQFNRESRRHRVNAAYKMVLGENRELTINGLTFKTVTLLGLTKEKE